MTPEIEREAGGRRVVRVRSDLELWLATGAVLLAAFAIHTAFFGRGASERLTGSICGSLMLAIAAVVAAERAEFVFDPDGRSVRWWRKRYLRTRAGRIPFDQIRAVAVQRPIGDRGVPMRRIALLAGGEEIPITVSFNTDPEDDQPRLAAELREVLGLPARGPQPGSVAALIEDGRRIDAILRVCEEESLSLAEAKQRVDELSHGLSQG